LNQKYLYLSLNLLSFFVTLALSFLPKANFAKKWKYVWPAIIASALIFLAGDVFFTTLGIRGFSETYTVGPKILGLPIEEVLFFICIPYASLCIYYILTQFIEKDYLFPHQELISSVIIVALLIAGGYFMHNLYTGITFLVTAGALAVVWMKLRMRFLGRFYFAFVILLVPFLIVHSITTGSFIDEPIVWFDDTENLGVRLGTIPLEDVVFSLLLLLIPLTIWEKLDELRYW
jgi:lycopene cyclase domain-containing protein